MANSLTLCEQLLLLALKDEKGTVVCKASVALNYSLVGALLLELAMNDRVAVRGNELGVLNCESCDDPLHNDVLNIISRNRHQVREVRSWVSHLESKIRKLKHRVADRMVASGILERREKKVLGIFRSVQYPTVNPLPELEVRERIRHAILAEENPSVETMMLASLIKACGLIDEVFNKDERKKAIKRIRKLGASDQVGAVVGEAISETVAAVQTAVIAGVSAAVIAATAARH